MTENPQPVPYKEANILTPFDHNDRLRRIYGLIQPFPSSAEIQPRSGALDQLFRDPQPQEEGEGPRTVFLSNIWDQESVRRNHEEKQKRLRSAAFRILNTQLIHLLRNHGHLTQPGNLVVISQFAADFANGQRPYDDLHGVTAERFGSKFLLEYPADYIHRRGQYETPVQRTEGIFSPDINHVKEIEREIYGQYMDWCEIGGFAERMEMVHELPLLKRWNLAFKEQYHEAPYPNLE